MRAPLSVWTYVFRNLRKILPTFIILTFVVLIVVVILSTLRGIKDGTLIFAREFNHFSVILPKKDPAISPEIKQSIVEHPAVERVVDSRNCMFMLRTFIAKIPFQIRAARAGDLRYMMDRIGIRLLEGELPRAGTNEVALHEIFMKANDWRIGQEFGMDVSDDDWIPGRFRIVGVLGGETPIGLCSFEYVAQADLYFFSAKLWERVLVFPKPGHEDELAAFLRTIESVRVWDRARAESEIAKSFDRLLLIVDFISMLLILVVALVVGLIHNIFFGQRSDEFAILLAAGHTQGRLLRKVVYETTAIMTAAWAAGAGLALGVLALFKALVLDPKGIPLPLFQPVPVLASLAMPVVALLFATGTIFSRFRRLDPVQIIERRG